MFFKPDSDKINVYWDAISQEIGYVRNKGWRKAINCIKLVKTEENAVVILKQFRQLRTKGVKAFIKAQERSGLSKEWIPIAEKSENAIFPIIRIDRKVIWYGLPKGMQEFRDKSRSTTFKTVCSIILRIQGSNTADLINSLADLLIVKADGTNSQIYSGSRTDLLSQKKKSSLPSFIMENEKCLKCGSPYELAVSRNGKDYLRCTGCDNIAYLNPATVNSYIHIHNVKCKVHHCGIHAAVGKYGIYVRCEAGHFMKVHEIE